MPENALALVTGASTGIGLEIAKLAATDGYDLLLAADTPLNEATETLRRYGTRVQAIEVDLSDIEGVDRLLAELGGRDVDVLAANAGHGLGHAFLDQDPSEWRHVIDTNVVGTVYLIQKIAQRMVARGEGRILVTGSIAGHIAGSFQAVYNGSKAFIDNFCDALGNELKDSGVSVTCLKPGATDTEFFKRAGMMDTKDGTMKKDDPADVAKTGWDAMRKGERSVIHGVMNKLQVAGAQLMGGGASAEMHRKQAEPGTS